MKRSKYMIILVPLAMLLAGTAVWLWTPRGVATEKKPFAEKAGDVHDSTVRPVATAVVQPLPESVVREFPGKVRATQTVQLAFSVSGVLIELNASEGRSVRKNELIAKLDPRDYQNALDVAKANFANAKQQYERSQALYAQKILPGAEFDRAKAAYDVAAAQLRIQEKALADTVLKAPFDGVIAARWVENHEHVEDKKPIVSIQDISFVEVVMQIPERIIARHGVNGLKDVSVRFDADESRWYEAALREFSTQADEVTRTYELVVGIKPPDEIEVLSGMTATVRTVISPRQPLAPRNGIYTIVPSTSVFTDTDGVSYVWLIDDDKQVPEKVRVNTGEPRNDGIEIRAGLFPGQRVAVAGVHSLKEDMRVRSMREGGEGLDG